MQKRVRVYNAVINQDKYTNQMLFTDKEWKKLDYYFKRDLLEDGKLAKVKVYNTEVFWLFGARFANTIKEFIN